MDQGTKTTRIEIVIFFLALMFSIYFMRTKLVSSDRELTREKIWSVVENMQKDFDNMKMNNGFAKEQRIYVKFVNYLRASSVVMFTDCENIEQL